MNNTWTSCVVLTVLAVSAFGILIWNRKKKKNFVKVGKVSKLYFFPVKSLKAVEVTRGTCTKQGFEVDGVLDRSFMLVNEEGVFIAQKEEPSLVLLTPEIKENYLIINAPNFEPLKVEIKKSASENDKIRTYKVIHDTVGGVDCGDAAALWFQSYLGKKGIRLVRFFPSCPLRKHTKKSPFFRKITKDHPVGFQNLAAFHIVSQPSIDDLNSRLEKTKISVLNFRPNILVEGCEAFAEDSWKYLKFQSEAKLENLMLTTRCLATTNDPETGILNKREPLVTLRKYRITSDPDLVKVLGSRTCFGTSCAVLSEGEIKVNDEIFAVVEKQPKMQIKAT